MEVNYSREQMQWIKFQILASIIYYIGYITQKKLDTIFYSSFSLMFKTTQLYTLKNLVPVLVHSQNDYELTHSLSCHHFCKTFCPPCLYGRSHSSINLSIIKFYLKSHTFYPIGEAPPRIYLAISSLLRSSQCFLTNPFRFPISPEWGDTKYCKHSVFPSQPLRKHPLCNIRNNQETVPWPAGSKEFISG